MELQPDDHVTGGVSSKVQVVDAGGDQRNKALGKYQVDEGKRSLLMASTDSYDKPLFFFGCGVGWFSFILGFAFPFLWYYATILYFGNYYHKDPRERAGLAASAIVALIFTVALLIALLAVFY